MVTSRQQKKCGTISLCLRLRASPFPVVAKLRRVGFKFRSTTFTFRYLVVWLCVFELLQSSSRCLLPRFGFHLLAA